MKKIIFSLIATVLLSNFTNAQKLDVAIAGNKDFVALINLFENTLTMPESDNFLKSFDEKRVFEEGNPFLVSITGYSLENVDNINKNIQVYFTAISKAFPELKGLSTDQLKETIVSASNIYSNNDVTGKISAACEACKREGRAEMAAGIILGGYTGSAGGIFGAWAGATVGFWVAAEHALTCIRKLAVMPRQTWRIQNYD